MQAHYKLLLALIFQIINNIKHNQANKNTKAEEGKGKQRQRQRQTSQTRTRQNVYGTRRCGGL